MPFSTYLPEHMGYATLSPPGPFVAGSYAELTLIYTAGTFGIDDTGMLKISWRTTSDMAKPQFTDPSGPNYTTVEASNGAKLEYWVERLNIRPWVNTLLIRVGRGFLRAGDTLNVRFGDRRQGSPGLRLQTNCEERFELKTYVDAFATYEFTELPVSPGFALVPGPAARFKAILPSLMVAGEPFRLAIVAEDLWGNPTALGTGRLALSASQDIRSLPLTITPGPMEGPLVLDNLVADAPGDVELRLAADTGEEVARANPMRVVASAPFRRYWGDLHGQSGRRLAPIRRKPTSDMPATNHFSILPDTRATIFRSRTPSGRSSIASPQNSTCRDALYACPATSGPAIPGWEATVMSSTAARGEPFTVPRAFSLAARMEAVTAILPPSCSGRLRGQTLWSSPMLAGGMLTFASLTMGAWSAPWRCIPPGARSNGCCTMPLSKVTALGSCATAMITRADPAQPARVHRPSERSEASPAT